MNKTDIVSALKGDFKLFLQALWTQLDLPPRHEHNMPLLIICNSDQSVYRSKLSEESVNRGLQARSSCGHSSMTTTKRL